MIISRRYARRLVNNGKAWEVGLMAEPGPWPFGQHYVIVQRTDRVDHYVAEPQDERRLIDYV